MYREIIRQQEQIEGTVDRVIYSNESNGYTVCDIDCAGELVTVTGVMPYICEGDNIKVYGKWVHNAQYGRQFKADQFEKTMPAGTNAILRYLSSGAVKGIGPKTAIKIVSEFGEDSFDVIENHPDWLAKIPGISKKKAIEASEDFNAKAGIRSAMMFFREYFGAAITVRIYKKWGSAAVERAKENPYILCNEIYGISFEKADTMARSLGINADSPERLKSGIEYILSHNAIQNGHTCLPERKLEEVARSLLEADSDSIAEAIKALLAEGRIVRCKMKEDSFIYGWRIYDEEEYIAKKLSLIDKLCPSVDVSDVSKFIDKEEARNGITYAAMQRKAITEAMISGVMILTGGPGTGKTTVVRALLGIFDSMGFKSALAAPTGRAAKRLSESTSREAKTLHRLLEMEYGTDDVAKFNRDENNLLDENAIIVDEASMIDTSLMCALMKAVKPGARLIIIGDSDQLPSVGAGNVLRDMIESQSFSVIRLNEIFRQAQKSLIVTNAHAVNEGVMPRLDIKDNDFFFITRNSDREVAETIADLYKNRLPRRYGADTVKGIQIISPSRRGEAGTETLNSRLQEEMNPQDGKKREFRFRERIFREGDKVMQIRNNYDIEWERDADGEGGLGIFNGDMGVVEKVDPANECMEIIFEDKRVLYDFSSLDELEHAYAITVHKSQGSEYPTVIIPIFAAAPMLLTRNLLYTAITRAQNMVILVGRSDIVRKMVENNRFSVRYTGLAERIKEEGR